VKRIGGRWENSHSSESINRQKKVPGEPWVLLDPPGGECRSQQPLIGVI